MITLLQYYIYLSGVATEGHVFGPIWTKPLFGRIMRITKIREKIWAVECRGLVRQNVPCNPTTNHCYQTHFLSSKCTKTPLRSLQHSPDFVAMERCFTAGRE